MLSSLGVSAYVAQIFDLGVFRREAAEAYTHGKQSFLFLDMPLWALLERSEKTGFWKMQQNDHNYSSQVFIFIVRLCSLSYARFAATLCVSLDQP